MRLPRQLATAMLLLALPTAVLAQSPDIDAMADAALEPPPPAVEAVDESTAPFLDLLLQSGWLMAPIVLMSIVVIAVAFERTLGLRRSRIRPRKLAKALRRQADSGDLDPQWTYNQCRRYRSSLARVVIATLAKGGRPHAEVEAAANDALQTEADRMYGNVRTLNLAAAVTPLMGLLGTVWGMIQAFFATSRMIEGADKATVLAEGIYVALMTTFAGLAVAIPAAVLAHYFEGRILRSLRKVESLMTLLMPRIEALEGAGRLDLRELELAYQDDRNGRPRNTAHKSPPRPHRARTADVPN